MISETGPGQGRGPGREKIGGPEGRRARRPEGWEGPPSAGPPAADALPQNPLRSPLDPPPPYPLPRSRTPSAGPPKISRFFSLFHSHFRFFFSLSLSLCRVFSCFFFLSLGVFSRNFGGVFERRDPQMCTFGLSGCRVKAPGGLQGGPEGRKAGGFLDQALSAISNVRPVVSSTSASPPLSPSWRRRDTDSA